ncbi:MAG: methyltransferase domain-containing protein [Candidatus Hodarchaeota archaeon]
MKILLSEAIKYRVLTGSSCIEWLNRSLRPANWLARFRTRSTIKWTLSNGGAVKVNIGCGRTRIDETWLHGDIHRGDIYVNAMKRFPFEDDSVDVIFSEQLIEHLPGKKIRKFWSECFRVLKPGGWMRHSTPDLDFIVKLYHGEIHDVDLDMFYQRIRHIRKDTPHPCIYMNEILTLWGHRFIYDESYLRKVWMDSGFVNVKRVRYGLSDKPELAGLEQHSKTGWVQNGFTLIMEAQKPPENRS